MYGNHRRQHIFERLYFILVLGNGFARSSSFAPNSLGPQDTYLGRVHWLSDPLAVVGLTIIEIIQFTQCIHIHPTATLSFSKKLLQSISICIAMSDRNNFSNEFGKLRQLFSTHPKLYFSCATTWQ